MTPLQELLVACVKEGIRAGCSSQVMLAERAGITQKHLLQMLTGRVEGSLSMWDRLLALTGADEAFRDALTGGGEPDAYTTLAGSWLECGGCDEAIKLRLRELTGENAWGEWVYASDRDFRCRGNHGGPHVPNGETTEGPTPSEG